MLNFGYLIQYCIGSQLSGCFYADVMKVMKVMMVDDERGDGGFH